VAVEHMLGGKAWGFKTQHSDFLHGSTDFPRWAAAEAPFRIQKPHARWANSSGLLSHSWLIAPFRVVLRLLPSNIPSAAVLWPSHAMGGRALDSVIERTCHSFRP
jgi:hypothetical protein